MSSAIGHDSMRIVCVHQGYELYGSDRCFIDSVAALRQSWPAADIEVILPQDGPIVPPLREFSSRIVIEPLFVLRRRHLARLFVLGPFKLIPALWRAFRHYRKADLVYVNAIVVFDYLLMARLFRNKTLVHVHEIPQGIELSAFRALLMWSGAEVIFNSKATRAAYNLPARRPQHVVYNGTVSPAEVTTVPYDGLRRLRVLLIGRINRIKGQDLLIEALRLLPRAILDRIEVRIVGDAFESDRVREVALQLAVRDSGLGSTVSFVPFANDPAPHYQWADIVVVPSRRPESLGRVAIEAMAHGRPALVAAIGGLVEVVEDGVSGWVVAPNRADLLAHKLSEIVLEPGDWSAMSQAARARAKSVFGQRTIQQQMQAIFRTRLPSAIEERTDSSELAHVEAHTAGKSVQ